MEPLIFSQKLRLARRKEGLNTTQAAKKSGLDPDRYMDIESGRHRPTCDDLWRICQGLKIQSMDFFEPEDFEKRAYWGIV